MSTLKVVYKFKRVYVFIFLFFLFHLIDTLLLGYSIKPKIFTLYYTDFQCYNQRNLNGGWGGAGSK